MLIKVKTLIGLIFSRVPYLSSMCLSVNLKCLKLYYVFIGVDK